MTEAELRAQVSERLQRLEPQRDSFDKMAARLGVPKSTLYHAWCGDRTVSVWQLYRLAKALKIAPGYFLEDNHSSVDILYNMRGASPEEIEHVNRYLLERRELRELRRERLK